MKKLLFGMALVILPMSGCYCGDGRTEEQQAADMQANMLADIKANEKLMDAGLASCGEFEAGTYSEDLVESKYAVCKDASTGSCYIKTFYPRPIPGCDMQFGTYRAGNPACFTWINNVHAMDGKITAESQTNYRPDDICGMTTEAYFRTKMPQP